MTLWDANKNVTTIENIKASFYFILMKRIFKVLYPVLDTCIWTLQPARYYCNYNSACDMKSCHLLLSVTVYEVHVTTRDLWNAGTEANVYISVHEERGDTGSRQLLRSQKSKKILKGQVSERQGIF